MFGEKLKEARINQNLKQFELAEKLGVKNTTISNWEIGNSNPDISIIEKICTVLHVDANYFFKIEFSNVLSYKELEHLEKYKKLDSYGKKQVTAVLNNEYDRVKEQMSVNDSSFSYMNQVSKTEYLTGLSAGTGLFVFDDVPTQLIKVPIEYKNIDFVISVSGDSMEPTYHDGDKVMVVKQESISQGEIGVFMVEGCGYIKELGNQVLISHNKKYPDILLNRFSDTRCIGKVIGSL